MYHLFLSILQTTVTLLCRQWDPGQWASLRLHLWGATTAGQCQGEHWTLSKCFFISNSCDFLERKEKLLEILTHLNEKCLIQVIIASNGQVTRTQNPPDQKKLRELRTLKQHYYPEGGWGWVVLLVAFLVHSLVLGTQTVLASIVISFGKPNSIARKLQPAVFSSASK